ncbi:S9 family peptidase [Pseudomonas sp. RP23018S]|uniref:S9 family peptidase n=1 Tax=Pseudomonas sp. RP23018S TaxID=3096037 RepID=UPI002ACA8FE1|nr:S9 family peptidase [Pseudomonas sp. RP23018S]MDZ5604119.1 S9 family peptidase [Pseudomonas sp. RP23018S]
MAELTLELSAADAVAAGTDFADLKCGPVGLVWNEFRPADGACRLWHWREQQAYCLTPDGFSVRSRVYEYGGGSFCLSDDGVLFVNEADQQVYRQPLDGTTPQPLSHEPGRRYGDLHWQHGVLLAVEETAGEPVVHRLVSWAEGQRQVLVEGADFYAAPTLRADGQRLAWIEWDRPEQPWTRTRLMSRERNADGTWQPATCVAGAAAQREHTAQSLQQPRFDAAGRLHALSDANGFWQPWAEIDGQWQPMPALAADHAGAPWQLGACTWLPLSDGGFVATWFDAGFGRLGVQHPERPLRQLAPGYSRLRCLAADEQCFYAVAASPTQLPAVLSIDREDGAVRVLAGGASLLAAEQVSQPQAISYPSGGATAHGFFYGARNVQGASPLVVFIHGGPTSACHPVLDPRIQYWTQRGFAVADLNYRGSTGYGRAYRQALHLQWGVSDVEDACAAVAHLAGRGLIDPQQAFIRGGSAGGYTTLCALAFQAVFRAGASLYGVSDPIALARATHKFEGDYLDWLIGHPERDAERYRQRTPLLHAANIKVPVIFFQGELDAVVVPEQTRSMLTALQANGIAAEGHFYAGERHGFRQARHLAHALEEEWKFYCRVLAG